MDHHWRFLVQYRKDVMVSQITKIVYYVRMLRPVLSATALVLTKSTIATWCVVPPRLPVVDKWV